MADGDTFDRNGRQWRKTTARKLFKREPTFVQSAIWSIDKTIRDGGLTAFAETVDLLQRGLDLQSAGIDCRMLFDARSREIYCAHPDQDSSVVIGLARGLMIDRAFVSTAGLLAGDEQRVFVSQQLLARYVVEDASTPDLLAALPSEASSDRRNLKQIAECQEWAVRELSRSADVRGRAVKLLGPSLSALDLSHVSSGDVPAQPQRPRIDRRKQVFDPAAFGD